MWLRDSAPIGVQRRVGRVVLLDWKFNAWAKYDNWAARRSRRDRRSPRLTGLPPRRACRPDDGERIVLEGGGIDVNGDGLLLVTEEWLLERHRRCETRAVSRGLRADVRAMARHRPDDLARRGMRRRRHPRPHRRHGAVRRARHGRAGGRAGSGRREPCAIDGQPASARARVEGTWRRGPSHRHAAVSARR